MRLTIFGAAGRTGTHLVEPALTAGHVISAISRDPQYARQELRISN